MSLIDRSRQSSTTGHKFLRDFLQDIIAYKTEHIQESLLTIIHFQHDKRYSLALEKSNFLQQMLQQQPPTIPAVSLSSRVSFYLPLAAERDCSREWVEHLNCCQVRSSSLRLSNDPNISVA